MEHRNCLQLHDSLNVKDIRFTVSFGSWDGVGVAGAGLFRVTFVFDFERVRIPVESIFSALYLKAFLRRPFGLLPFVFGLFTLLVAFMVDLFRIQEFPSHFRTSDNKGSRTGMPQRTAFSRYRTLLV